MHAKSDPAAGVNHLCELHDFAQRIASRGFAVYEHHWDVTDSLDWIVVAGTPEQRFEFGWNSTRRVLSVERCTDAPEQPVQTWKPLSKRAAVDTAAAFQEIEAFLDEHAKT